MWPAIDKKSDTIALNADLDRVKVAGELKKQLGIDINLCVLPENSFCEKTVK